MKKLMIVGVLLGMVGLFFAGRMSVTREVSAGEVKWKWEVFSYIDIPDKAGITSYESMAKFLNKRGIENFIVLPDSNVIQAGILYK